MSDAEAEILRDAEQATDERDEIVVGLDTSPAASAALRWAAEYARAVGGSLARGDDCGLADRDDLRGHSTDGGNRVPA